MSRRNVQISFSSEMDNEELRVALQKCARVPSLWWAVRLIRAMMFFRDAWGMKDAGKKIERMCLGVNSLDDLYRNARDKNAGAEACLHIHRTLDWARLKLNENAPDMMKEMDEAAMSRIRSMNTRRSQISTASKAVESYTLICKQTLPRYISQHADERLEYWKTQLQIAESEENEGGDIPRPAKKAATKKNAK